MSPSMSFMSHLEGIGSGAAYPADAVMNLCPRDQRPVQMVLDLDRLRRERGRDGWYNPGRPNMWRFGGMLPLDMDNAGDRRWIVSLGEGHTPLLELSDQPQTRSLGIRLLLKQDGWPQPGFGSNPTQSFKDRGMAVVASMARRLGLTKLAVPTQGNAGDSLVEYARAAGLDVAVVMPEDTPQPIRGRVAAMAAKDTAISLELVGGTIREAGTRVKEHWVPQGYFNVATFQEPGWRIEGKKTLGLEISEPAEPGGDWHLPDVIVYPTGGGTGILGMWKAFDELEALGLVGPERPRMVAVQSEATAPIVRAFREGNPDTEGSEAGRTMAVGLNVPSGVGHFRVLQILRASGGGALSVSEQSMEQIMRSCFRERGWRMSPEGAATLAVLPMLRDCGLMPASATVVVVNTGSADKYVPDFASWVS
jgi:threonine synthase